MTGTHTAEPAQTKTSRETHTSHTRTRHGTHDTRDTFNYSCKFHSIADAAGDDQLARSAPASFGAGPCVLGGEGVRFSPALIADGCGSGGLLRLELIAHCLRGVLVGSERRRLVVVRAHLLSLLEERLVRRGREAFTVSAPAGAVLVLPVRLAHLVGQRPARNRMACAAAMVCVVAARRTVSDESIRPAHPGSWQVAPLRLVFASLSALPAWPPPRD